MKWQTGRIGEINSETYTIAVSVKIQFQLTLLFSLFPFFFVFIFTRATCFASPLSVVTVAIWLRGPLFPCLCTQTSSVHTNLIELIYGKLIKLHLVQYFCHSLSHTLYHSFFDFLLDANSYLITSQLCLALFRMLTAAELRSMAGENGLSFWIKVFCEKYVSTTRCLSLTHRTRRQLRSTFFTMK